MIERGISKIPVASNCCVFSTRGTRCHIFVTILILSIEKKEHHGAGACINTALRRQEMKFTTISFIWDAKTIVAWCSPVMGQGARRQEEQSSQKAHVHRYFWEVVDVDRSHIYECKTVQGTHAFHSFRMSDNAIVEMLTIKLSCFCYPCCSGELDNYESIDWVDSWDRVSLPIGWQITLELFQLGEC